MKDVDSDLKKGEMKTLYSLCLAKGIKTEQLLGRQPKHNFYFC